MLLSLIWIFGLHGVVLPYMPLLHTVIDHFLEKGTIFGAVLCIVRVKQAKIFSDCAVNSVTQWVEATLLIQIFQILSLLQDRTRV